MRQCLPEGTSTEITGTRVTAIAAMMEKNGARGNPSKEKPKMLSTIKSKSLKYFSCDLTVAASRSSSTAMVSPGGNSDSTSIPSVISK